MTFEIGLVLVFDAWRATAPADLKWAKKGRVKGNYSLETRLVWQQPSWHVCMTPGVRVAVSRVLTRSRRLQIAPRKREPRHLTRHRVVCDRPKQAGGWNCSGKAVQADSSAAVFSLVTALCLPATLTPMWQIPWYLCVRYSDTCVTATVTPMWQLPWHLCVRYPDTCVTATVTPMWQLP